MPVRRLVATSARRHSNISVEHRRPMSRISLSSPSVSSYNYVWRRQRVHSVFAANDRRALSLPLSVSQPSSLSPRRHHLFQCDRFRMNVADASETNALETSVSKDLDIEKVQYRDGRFSVTGKLIAPVSATEAFEILTDYSALPEVFHNVEECSLHVAENGCKHLVQYCSWKFLIFKGTFVTELDITEHPSECRLKFSLRKESAFMRNFVGAWDVRDVTSREGYCEIIHVLAVSPSVAPPQKLGDITSKIFAGQVHGILRDLEKELMRRRASKG